MDRTLITGTTIFDGSGVQPFVGDVLVEGQRIAAVQRGMAEELGQIKPGYLADLLLVDGNPLEDIKLLQNRDALLVIMKDGQLYKQPAT